MSPSHSCPHSCVACETASAAMGNERRLRLMVRGTARALNGKRSVWFGLSSYKANP